MDRDICWSRHYVGTDSSQGKGQVISNINACLAVQATIRSTLGPYGGDLLLVDANGRQTITNDGATVMKVPSPCSFCWSLNLTCFSSSTSSTPPLESWQTSRDHKTQKSEMEQRPLLCLLERFWKRLKIMLSRESARRQLSKVWGERRLWQ